VYGQRVRFHRHPGPAKLVSELKGEGVFELAWLGIEECWEIRLDDGEQVSLFPCFGDTMEPL
jgi:hypothetical protein